MKTLFISLAALLLTFTLNAQIINFPDANFKAALIAEGVDTNSDGEIQVSEAEALDELRVDSQSISSMEGIEYFTNLELLFCNDNQLISLDVSSITSLLNLYCSDNLLTSLNFGANIRTLNCENNQLTSLNLSSAINLESLGCDNNQLTALDLSNQTEVFTALGCNTNNLTTLNVEHLTMMTWLHCAANQLTSLNLSSNSNLTFIYASQNQLTTLDLSNLTDLWYLYIDDNLLTTVDISNSGELRQLVCSNNQLVSLNLKNGTLNYNENAQNDDYYLEFENNPTLEFICADYSGIGISPGEEIDIVQDLIDTYGYTNCAVSSYCSFVPGGSYYTVEGTIRLDLDANGCDVSDGSFNHLNFSITDGTETGAFITDSSGDYSIPVQEGTHTITPTLENPSYFTISPTEIIVDFPTDTSPYSQDFCITPNGTHNDLEITLIPIDAARPGFDTNYKVIYKNKGNTSLSGSVDLAFQDDVMDFVMANPSNESGLPDLLSWTFNDLLPFETREITFTMNLNAPTDSPPLNDADVLEFIASITSSETDETPDDNTFIFNQTVVNSFDPNDKTCLEGPFVELEDVGEYAHYMIRFENTGTADAINIVVKDEIDVTKYDLTTLVPLHASHDYFANIKSHGSDNYVEFIFEDINLPFDDANNDGYIAFKIKTLNTLELGDTFENNAEIYFDYNFPIITNTAQTTVSVLSIEEFELANNSVLLYPNPTTHIINLEARNAINQVNIYDVFGRSIKEIAVIGHKTNLNISTESLATGTYFVKVKTANGEIVKKMIKE